MLAAKWEQLKYLTAALSALNQLTHTDECGANDGAGCGCYYDDAVRYCRQRIETIEKEVEYE